MENVIQYLIKSVQMQAVDMFIQAGSPVMAKVSGKIVKIDEKVINPIEARQFINQIYQIAGKEERGKEDKMVDEEFSFHIKDVARFRVSIYKQRGSCGAVIRVVAFDIPDYREMHISEDVMNLSNLESGLVIITGSACSGKSTTQACIVDSINEHYNKHIITIEDPIEFLHRNKKSLITQREIPLDVADYDTAIRSALRQAPDVIVLNGIKDVSVLDAAISAAEDGHLVFATVTASSCSAAVTELVNMYPIDQREECRKRLGSLTTVVHQLLVNKNGEVVPEFEII